MISFAWSSFYPGAALRSGFIILLAVLAFPAYALIVPIEPSSTVSKKVSISRSEKGHIEVKSIGGSLQEVLQAVQSASDISFFVSAELLMEPMELEIKGSDWPETIQVLLQGYDFANSYRENRIVKIFVLERGEDFPLNNQFPATIDEREMESPKTAPKPSEIEKQMASRSQNKPSPNEDEVPVDPPSAIAGTLPPEIEPEILENEPDPNQDQMQDYKDELEEKGSIAVGSPQLGPDIPEDLRGDEAQLIETGDGMATTAEGNRIQMPEDPGVVEAELSGVAPPGMEAGN